MSSLASAFVPYSAERASFYKQKGCWLPDNHMDFLANAKASYGDAIAVMENDKTLSYAALYKYAVIFGNYLSQSGIRKDDFIIIQSPNVIEFFIVLFGLYHVGARPVFCLHGHGAHEIQHIANVSGAVGFIKIKHLVSELDAVDITSQFSTPNLGMWYLETIHSQATLQASLPVLFVDAGYQNPDLNQHPSSSYTLNPSSNHNQDQANSCQCSSEHLAFLQLSGGTTGLPKLIPRTHADYLYSVRLSAAVANLTSTSKQLVVLPVMHNFTMSSPGFLGAFYVGATVVLSTDTSPSHCFALIQKHAITQVSLVPTLVNLWLNSPVLEDFDLSSLQVIQVGGSKLLPTVAEKMISTLDIKLQQVYGMAEGLVNFTHLDDDPHTITHTQGKALSPYDEICIVDDAQNPVEPNTIGNIYTKGPYTINGYYNADAINKTSFTEDGFYKTGDIGYLDDKGNIVVTGRKKDQINRAGEKVSPSELESLIIDHKSVKDISVVGIADDVLGEKIKAFVIPTNPQAHISLQEIRTFLQQKHVAAYKMPDEVEVVTDFRYTHVGKVNKNKLKAG